MRDFKLSGYISAAAESFSYELFSYLDGTKKLTADNIVASLQKIGADVIVNGTTSLIADKMFSFADIRLDLNAGFDRGFIQQSLTKTGSKILRESVKSSPIENMLQDIFEMLDKNLGKKEYKNETNPIVAFN